MVHVAAYTYQRLGPDGRSVITVHVPAHEQRAPRRRAVAGVEPARRRRLRVASRAVKAQAAFYKKLGGKPRKTRAGPRRTRAEIKAAAGARRSAKVQRMMDRRAAARLRVEEKELRREQKYLQRRGRVAAKWGF